MLNKRSWLHPNALWACALSIFLPLAATDAGDGCESMAETDGRINAFTFYLEGGWSAWDAHRQMQEATQPRQTIVSQSTAPRAGDVKGRPGGCGGCSK